MRLAIMMADGCEEIEGLTVVDLCRRAGIEIDMISITGNKSVVGSHNIKFEADALYEDVKMDSYEGIILPGGMPGTRNLQAHPGLAKDLKAANEAKKLVAAICAAPLVLGQLGIMNEKNGTSYPGFEQEMPGCNYSDSDSVVVDGNIITSRGMGTAIDFALEIIAYCKDEDTANTLADGIMY